MYFNPHSPCGERLSNQQTMQLADIFQSTLPLRGATNLPPYIDERYLISIHTPLAGSDAFTKAYKLTYDKFQSTLPLRGATLSKWT